jgi:hypothetical protein
MIETITQNNLYQILPLKICLVAEFLQEDEGLSTVETIKKIYSSETYKRLERESSKAWWLGPTTLYYDLREELDKH